MRTLPPEPNAGDKISANLIREIIRAIRERTPLQGPGIKLSIGPNGTTITADSGVSKSTSKVIPGCFEIRKPRTNSVDDPGGFDNPYFMCGSMVYSAANCSNIGTLQPSMIYFLVVSLGGSQPEASISSVNSFAEVQAMASNDSVFIYPLYRTDENGVVVADMRNIPTLMTREWTS